MNMQIVINIPEKINNRLRSFLGHGYALRDEDVKIIAKAVYNGQPEQKKGKWIKGQDVPNRKLYYHLKDVLYCSVCYEEAFWDTDDGQQLFAYCPYCGAKMEVEG